MLKTRSLIILTIVIDGTLDGSYCNYTAFGITGDSPKFDVIYPDVKHKNGYKGQLQCGKYPATDVVSLSYITGETNYPMNYERRQCNEYMKLGLQGKSMIFASGDRGVQEHFNVRGPLCLGEKRRKFGPNNPVNCPFVTGVGATLLLEDGKTEVAVRRFGSGGGFSNIFPRPKYQEDAVSTYLNEHTPSYESYNVTYKEDVSNESGRYNSAGRGYPDVSTLGDHISVIYHGKHGIADGTSASTPLSTLR